MIPCNLKEPPLRLFFFADFRYLVLPLHYACFLLTARIAAAAPAPVSSIKPAPFSTPVEGLLFFADTAAAESFAVFAVVSVFSAVVPSADCPPSMEESGFSAAPSVYFATSIRLSSTLTADGSSTRVPSSVYQPAKVQPSFEGAAGISAVFWLVAMLVPAITVISARFVSPSINVTDAGEAQSEMIPSTGSAL